MKNRPYIGGERYNCLELVAEFSATNTTRSLVGGGSVADSECSRYLSCPVCRVENKSRCVVKVEFPTKIPFPVEIVGIFFYCGKAARNPTRIFLRNICNGGTFVYGGTFVNRARTKKFVIIRRRRLNNVFIL